MLKAGKDALKASASSEALNYYQETLNIYMRKCGETADPEKIAMLEKNIAVALFNKGQYVAADEHFVNALSFYGEKFPRSKLAVFLKFSRGFLSFLIHLYMHRLFKNRVPTKSDSENINLLYKKNTALIVIDPKRMFVESFYWLDRLLRFNLRGIENGVGILSMSGAAFSYSGVSFRLSRKVLEFVEDKVDRNDIKSVLYYELPKVIFYFFFGEWDEIGEYDEKMVEQNIRIGELFYSSSYILVFGQAAIKWGDLSKALALAGKIFEIADVYENDNAKAAYYWFNTQLLLKFRKLQEAYREAEEGIQFTKKTGFQPYYFSLCAFKAKIALFWGNAREAEEIIDYLSKIESGINMPPYILYTYLLSWFSLDLFRLEESKIAGDKIRYSIFKKSALKIGKKAFNNVKGNAENHVEIMKLMGEYYWMTGRQAIALKWWRKGIKKGRMLGAKLDLSRLYMNAGQRLCEEKSRYREIIGMSGEELLDTAREMFAEMNLQWDLERLDQGQG
jgi:tetratricopeptide (TPR) repeat protein